MSAQLHKHNFITIKRNQIINHSPEIMNKKIQILIIAAILVVAGVVLYDSLGTRVDKRPDNPYEYNIDEFRDVDESMVTYREARQIEIDTGDPKAFAWHNENLYLVTDRHLQVINVSGREILKKTIDPDPVSVKISPEGSVIVVYTNYLVKYNGNGDELLRSEAINEDSFFRSVAFTDNSIFVADAGKRVVAVFNHQLEFISSFKGESGVSALHGFILPSLHFDMAVNQDGELWVVNPGMHRIQNYAESGRLRGHWGVPSFGWEGFSGCCNPYYIAFLSDGRVVTSEKGLVRVKIYKESGELESVVAAPERFPNSEKAPAIAVDDHDNVWLLDFDKKLLRLFRPV
jgi:hypothetical protein